MANGSVMPRRSLCAVCGRRGPRAVARDQGQEAARRVERLERQEEEGQVRGSSRPKRVCEFVPQVTKSQTRRSRGNSHLAGMNSVSQSDYM
eukprot:2529661-Prymnesium_polylepis.1